MRSALSLKTVAGSYYGSPTNITRFGFNKNGCRAVNSKHWQASSTIRCDILFSKFSDNFLVPPVERVVSITLELSIIFLSISFRFLIFAFKKPFLIA